MYARDIKKNEESPHKWAHDHTLSAHPSEPCLDEEHCVLVVCSDCKEEAPCTTPGACMAAEEECRCAPPTGIDCPARECFVCELNQLGHPCMGSGCPAMPDGPSEREMKVGILQHELAKMAEASGGLTKCEARSLIKAMQGCLSAFEAVDAEVVCPSE